jgi:redox-sensitive bicupin YhaK (pirin superfamily)
MQLQALSMLRCDFLIRIRQLNLMSSGGGIVHAEEGIDAIADPGGHGGMGIQMWLAQTEATRHGGPVFQHLSTFPTVEFGSARPMVLFGMIAGESSAAEVDQSHHRHRSDSTLPPILCWYATEPAVATPFQKM